MASAPTGSPCGRSCSGSCWSSSRSPPRTETALTPARIRGRERLLVQRAAATLTQRKQDEKVNAVPRKRQPMSSRFQIHDDLTAPEGSLPILKGALATGGQLPNFLRGLARSPPPPRAHPPLPPQPRHR